MKNKKMFFIVITAMLSVIVVITCVYISLSNSVLFKRHYESETKIVSPDGNHTVIIKQFSVMGGSGAEVYYKGKGDLRKIRKGQLIFDDYTLPFSDERAYSVSWGDDEVEIKYYSGTPAENIDNPETWKVFYIKYK